MLSVEEFIGEMAGGDVMPLIKSLKKKKIVSEITLAKEIGRELNKTRSTLYKLQSHNLVKATRTKNNGFYEYHWALNLKRVKSLIKNSNANRLDILNCQLQREVSTQFYRCKNGCVRVDFDKAANLEFRCPECGVIVELEDNTSKIKKLKQEIKKLR